MDEGVEITLVLLRGNVPSPSLRINSESGILHKDYDNISAQTYLNRITWGDWIMLDAWRLLWGSVAWSFCI